RPPADHAKLGSRPPPPPPPPPGRGKLRRNPFFPAPITRRTFLRAGALALGGLTLPDLLVARGAAPAPPDTSVILFWMWGGPSHLETYDLKPDAPTEYRGPFRPIRTTVPGLDICELLPRQARLG